jgi:hypothetical protein
MMKCESQMRIGVCIIGRHSRAGGNLNATYKPYQGITIPNQVGMTVPPDLVLACR